MARIKNKSKREIYESYGILYDPENEKILSPEFGWINPVLINGNTKLGRGVWTFSTLPSNRVFHVVINGKAYDIKGTCPCNCAGCYAQKGHYNGTDVKAANARKTFFAYYYLGWLKRAILAQIEADKIQLLRIHASGDFFSANYIEMWREIVNRCPACVFWTYTKNPAAEKAFDDCSNINIVRSVIPGVGFNFGKCEYIIKVYNALTAAGKRVHICRCGMDKNQHCTSCRGCTENEFVLFVEHSTGYNAEKDPAFPELCALIERQEK